MNCISDFYSYTVQQWFWINLYQWNYFTLVWDLRSWYRANRAGCEIKLVKWCLPVLVTGWVTAWGLGSHVWMNFPRYWCSSVESVWLQFTVGVELNLTQSYKMEKIGREGDRSWNEDKAMLERDFVKISYTKFGPKKYCSQKKSDFSNFFGVLLTRPLLKVIKSTLWF